MTSPTLGVLNTSGRGNWIRLRTLIMLRWFAIAGQLAAISVSYRIFGLDLPLGLCFVVVGVSVIANLMLQRAPKRVPASALPSLEAFGWIESTEGRTTIIELATDLRPLDAPEPEPDPRERQLVAALSSSRANPVHD